MVLILPFHSTIRAILALLALLYKMLYMLQTCHWYHLGNQKNEKKKKISKVRLSFIKIGGTHLSFIHEHFSSISFFMVLICMMIEKFQNPQLFFWNPGEPQPLQFESATFILWSHSESIWCLMIFLKWPLRLIKLRVWFTISFSSQTWSKD